MEQHCQNKFQVEVQQKSNGSNSSMKSFGSAGSGSQKGSVDYLRAILTNVFTLCGYRHFSKYFKRTGKSKLSLPTLIKQLQAKFTQEEWYYLRKIHKKANNYFLNKNGKIGDVGSGWVELSSKNSKSGVSTHSQKSGGLCVCHAEETKGSCVCAKKTIQHIKSEKTRARSYSDSSNSKMSAENVDNEHCNMAAMNMIDEDIHEDEKSDNSQDDHLDDLSAPMSSNDISIDNEGEWKLVSDRKERQQKYKATINLKDLKESDFLEMIDSKNQNKRFFGWLNFQPLFQEFDPHRFGNPAMESDLQNKSTKEFKSKQQTDYSNIDDFAFVTLFDIKMDEE